MSPLQGLRIESKRSEAGAHSGAFATGKAAIRKYPTGHVTGRALEDCPRNGGFDLGLTRRALLGGKDH